MSEFETIDKIPNKRLKVEMHLIFIQELGGNLHQQNNVIGNAGVGAAAGNELKASLCALETLKRITKHKECILNLMDL